MRVRAAFAFTMLAVFCAAGPAHAGDGPVDPSGAVTAELRRQEAAWNAGNIDGFLDGYERGPGTTMVGGDKVMHGWDEIAARYHSRYAGRARMGKLAFGELAIRPLGGDYAVAVGHWALERGADAGGNVGGWFTLVLHRGAAGWRIISDHTS
jgi:hypothetical protein